MNVMTNGAPVASQDVDHVVSVLREHAVALCAQAGRAPSVVRLSARDVVVEVHWPEAAAPRSEHTAPPVAPPASDERLADAPAAVTSDVVELCAGTVGVFYHASEPGAQPFVAVGDVVQPGRQVGIVEAMKLMIPVHAEVAGKVLAVLVPDGTPVEYGQPLFALEPR